jgi:pilus assembly protein Flp/PilA
MMMTVFNFLRGLAKSKKGQGMVEYGLIVGLIAVAVIAVLGFMGDEIVVLFTKVKDALVGANAPA